MKLKAKYKIIISMIDLLEDYPFEQISIKMICAKCKINRSTFYDNFQINTTYCLQSKVTI